MGKDIHRCLVAKKSRVQLFCDPMAHSPQSFSVHGISQARILEWVAISFSRGSSRPRDQTGGGFFITEPLGKPKDTCMYG